MICIRGVAASDSNRPQFPWNSGNNLDGIQQWSVILMLEHNVKISIRSRVDVLEDALVGDEVSACVRKNIKVVQHGLSVHQHPKHAACGSAPRIRSGAEQSFHKIKPQLIVARF